MPESSSAVSRRNRANKNRGRAFERTIADYLGWQRVPYSGGVKEWGGADVVDGNLKANGGLWAAECKTQQPGAIGSISVNAKWMRQMEKGRTKYRHPVLITKNVGEMIDECFVLFKADDFEWFWNNVTLHRGEPALRTDVIITIKAHPSGSFTVKPEVLAATVAGQHMALRIDGGSTYSWWYIMRLEDFRIYIDKFKLAASLDND